MSWTHAVFAGLHKQVTAEGLGAFDRQKDNIYIEKNYAQMYTYDTHTYNRDIEYL